MKDPTAWFEDLINDIVDEAMEEIKLGPEILNRPPLSTPVPKEEQHRRWVEATQAALAGDMTLFQARFDDLSKVYGPEVAELELRLLDKKEIL